MLQCPVPVDDARAAHGHLVRHLHDTRRFVIRPRRFDPQSLPLRLREVQSSRLAGWKALEERVERPSLSQVMGSSNIKYSYYCCTAATPSELSAIRLAQLHVVGAART